MANIKNVVKVMNFHSLLRVDASKREAESYRNVGEEVTKIIKTIVYNKNLVLDKKVIMPNPENNKLNIYIANDLGFCGSFNSNINEVLRQDRDSDKIIIGKKIIQNKSFDNVIMTMTKDEYFEGNSQINKIMFEAIKDKKYKSINLIYNHYYNVSRIERVKQQILPLEKTKTTWYNTH